MARRFRLRPVLLGAALLLVVIPAAAPSEAGTSTAALTLSKTKAPPTAVVLVNGSGFGAGEQVDLSIDASPLATAQTDPVGGFSQQVTIPADTLPGSHPISALGEQSGLGARHHFTVRANWAAFRFNGQHRGYNPFENILNPSNVPGLTLVWEHDIPSTGTESSPAIVNGVVYTTRGPGQLFALNAATGRWLWKANAGAGMPSPAVADGVVYVAAEGGRLYAVDSATGAIRWSRAIDYTHASPAVANGIVYIASDEHNILYAFDAATGKPRWSTKIAGDSVWASSPVVANGLVYFGSVGYGGRIHAFDAQTGQERWAAGSGGLLAVSDGVLYAPNGSVLNAYNAATGQIRWSAPLAASDSSPAVANGIVYVGSADHHLYAFDARTGAVRWSAATGAIIRASPAVANGVVYITSMDPDGSAYAFDAVSGALLWSKALGVWIMASPAVANGLLYISTGDGRMLAFGVPGASSGS